ncbi:acyltransferase family protein [Leptothoe sp. PORK10 BA2]|uniref:acyltransferase family protein n=1 Tax=Leptothoe sp. PORK10 BA2 TaxID=3110254 RepID=UPI002B21A0E5|nr:acyltransferase [Leptothoe sp. PORK10 BA2]MEA5465657.1 acyltransferase [Leptothoe sp. PORK10 BA2]
MKSATKTIKQSSQKLELLESLRGIAALLIVAFHGTELFRLKFNQPFLLSLFEFGDSGVDFFFVLSGFLLALTSFKYIGHQNSAKEFLIKRCERIYPFYWFVSLCIIPVYFLVPSFGKGYETDITVIIKSLLLIPQEHAPIISAAWFLSHLVFFYFVFALVIFIPKVASKLVLAGLSISAFVALGDIFSGFQLWDKTHFLINFTFSYYNLEFLAGCLLGTIFKTNQLKKSVSLSMLVVGCLAFCLSGLLEVYVLQISAETTGFSHYYEFMTYGLSSILIIGGAAFLEKSYRISINRWFVMLGAAAFSIYLTHYPILSIFTKAMQVAGLNRTSYYTVGMVLACVMTVLIGALAHVYVEKRVAAMFRNRLTYKKA